MKKTFLIPFVFLTFAFSFGIDNTQSIVSSEKDKTLKSIKDDENQTLDSIDKYQKMVKMRLILTLERFWLISKNLILVEKTLISQERDKKMLDLIKLDNF